MAWEEMATAAMAEEAQAEAILGFQPRFSSISIGAACLICVRMGSKNVGIY